MRRRCCQIALLLWLMCHGGRAVAAPEVLEITPDASLSGWVVEGTEEFTKDGKKQPTWSVGDDGVLTCWGNGFGFLRYDREVCDFVLKLEYRMTKNCNSGIGIRTVKYKDTANSRPSLAAYEIQILDDAGKKPDEHSSMSLYRYLAATANAVKPAGEWNQFEIDCRGPRIRIVLNGQTVQDVDQSASNSIKDKPLCGYVSVQNHGKTIDFRKLRIKELNSGK